MAKKITNEELTMDLGSAILAALNSKSKLKAAYILSEADNCVDVKDWISTGSTILDLAVSNRPYGGLPCGRITEIFGASASGKSLLAAHAIVSTQKKDGIGVYIDTEAAVSSDFLKAIGVDLDKMIYTPTDTIEDAFQYIEKIIMVMKEVNAKKLQEDKNFVTKPLTIILDSIMGASTKVEMDSDYEKDGWATTKALVLSKAMRKITNLIAQEKVCLILLNQTRQKLGVTFGDATTTSGGSAVGFHSSVRIRLKDLGKIEGTFNNVKSVIGKKTMAEVVKNRLGPPLRKASYHIYFQSGIDNSDSWLEQLKTYNLVKQGGSWYTYSHINEETGEVKDYKFLSKDFASLLESNPELKEDIYNKICKNFIVEYDTNSIGIDDIEITELHENGD